jgi:hypothetical protein
MATSLGVSPTILELLATKQEAAAEKSGEAAGATGGLTTAVWVTHGVISGVSNGAFSSAEDMRKKAGQNLATAGKDLAAKLRAAKQAYTGVDHDLGDNIDKTQMLDK